jgi:hypothetical protein
VKGTPTAAELAATGRTEQGHHRLGTGPMWLGCRRRRRQRRWMPTFFQFLHFFFLPAPGFFLFLLVSLLCFDRIFPFFRSFLSSFALFSFFVLAGAQ